MQRMKKAGKEHTVVDTYDSLVVKLTDLEAEMSEIEEKLEQQQTVEPEESVLSSYQDSLEAFMQTIKSGSAKDKLSRSKLKLKLYDLKKEKLRLEKLIKIAKPAALPELKKFPSSGVAKKSTNSSKSFAVGKMPMIGSIKKSTTSFKKFMSETATSAVSAMPSSPPKEEEEEEEEDEEEVAMEELKPNSSTSEENSRKDSDETHQCSSPAEKVRTVPVVMPSQKRLVSMQDPDTVQEVKKPKKAAIKSQPASYILEEDDTYAAWMPPVGQTGDGKTHLNEKYGY